MKSNLGDLFTCWKLLKYIAIIKAYYFKNIYVDVKFICYRYFAWKVGEIEKEDSNDTLAFRKHESLKLFKEGDPISIN